MRRMLPSSPVQTDIAEQIERRRQRISGLQAEVAALRRRIDANLREIECEEAAVEAVSELAGLRRPPSVLRRRNRPTRLQFRARVERAIRAVAERGPLSPAELSEALGDLSRHDARYVLTRTGPFVPTDGGRFALPEGGDAEE